MSDEITLSSDRSNERVRLVRDRGQGACSMVYSGTSPRYNNGETVMSTPVDLSVAAALLDVTPQELAPVAQDAGRLLGDARGRITTAWESKSPPAPMTYAQLRAIASGTHPVPEESGATPPVAAGARATFEAGGSAVTEALARLHAKATPINHRDDRPHHARGGPSIR